MLSNFKWFRGSTPLGGGGWVDGDGGGYGCVGGCPMHARMHTYADTHTHTCTHARTCMLNMLNMDASMLVAICNFYTCINVHVCVCMHAHVCACVWGYPPCPQMPPPPTCPLPRAAWRPKHQNSISPELIEIIRFCLKICDPWTLLHTYRLVLMCRWGVSYFKWHFYVFDAKKCSCDPPIKNFPVLALDPIRPYLDWALRGFLTS